ncbi:hypothetical protein Tco_0890535 [Tanacetum coccineum]|uniref:Uncharacterized protein n=1 Tax=Tanacetum coccineum TaxID=301880 RepID=A0ABQ5C3S8_9ASTR
MLAPSDGNLTLYQAYDNLYAMTEPGDGVTLIKRRCHDIHGDGVRDLATASGRGRLKVDLEPSTWRRRQESRDDVKSRRKTVTKDVGNMSVEELVRKKQLWLVKLVMMTYVKTARSRNIGIVIGENVNPTFSEDDDFDSVIDMKQRFKGSAELEKMYNGNTNSESECSDKSINYLFEVVGCSRPNGMYDVGKSDTVIMYDEHMDKLMHRLRDNGDVLTYPFIILENDQSNKKFLIYDEHAHWKMRKAKYVDTA